MSSPQDDPELNPFANISDKQIAWLFGTMDLFQHQKNAFALISSLLRLPQAVESMDDLRRELARRTPQELKRLEVTINDLVSLVSLEDWQQSQHAAEEQEEQLDVGKLLETLKPYPRLQGLVLATMTDDEILEVMKNAPEEQENEEAL